MNNLQTIEYKQIRVLTTQQLAECYETQANNIKFNFNNNKERFIEGRDYYLLKGQALKEFKNSVSDTNIVGKNANTLYLWTERGANRHSKILDTDKAWQQFDVLEETYFRVKNSILQISTDPMSLLKLTYDALEQVQSATRNNAKEINNTNNRVKELEENKLLNPGEYNYLSKAVRKRVRTVKEVRNLELTKEQNNKIYSAINRDLNNYIGVKTRSQFKEKDFDKALEFVNGWEPSYTDMKMINQLSMNI